MKRLILITLGIVFILNTPVAAQQAGENINVLPVVPQSVPNWEIKGDGYLQRQVEPTIAASTLNPDHLLAFFNDYRAVDAPDDSYIGEDQFEVASLALNVAEFMLAGLIPLPEIPFIESPPIAAAEAWVGMSRSYDGGLTWAGGFLPGADFDGSDASLASPVYGLEAATDPVLAPGPCGYFYVVFVAFTRGGESKLAVARYQDLNNDEGGDTISYLGTTVIESGNNADNGHFLDKPDIEVDVWRGDGGPEQCGHRVYVTYSTFVGLDKYEKFQSKVNFAKSEDFGLTYSTVKINKTWNQNQGSTIAIDPGIGVPDNKGGPGTIYVAWRHFFDPDAIIVRKSVNYGASWATPVVVNNPAMDPFDQPTLSTDYLSEGLAFRSNGFPTATVNDDGQVFVAWQERTESNGSPRIVLTRSDDDGKNWNSRQVVDDATLQKPYNAGTGGAWQDNLSRGPQVMPKLSFGGGRLMLAYYESRGLISSVSDPDDLHDGRRDFVAYSDLTGPSPGYITGYDRVVDFRAALLEPYGVDAGTLIDTSSIQVSRYPIGATADLTDGQQLEDVAHAAPCDPTELLGPTNPPCARQVNRVNAPTSAGGTSPFIGDYPDLVPMLQFVPDGAGGWKWATGAADVPSRGFHAIFTDNRNIIPPIGYEEWEHYGDYSPPGQGVDLCANAGSRNSNVYTSRVDADLVISTPTTSKQLDVTQRSLPFSVRNRTNIERYYRFEIDTDNIGDASFSFTGEPIECGEVKIFAYSGVSQVVYVNKLAPGPVKVHVIEINGPTETCSGNITNEGQTGTVTFSLDGAVENIPSGEQDVQDPFVQNPFVQNPFVRNYGAENPFVQNSGYTNYSVSNPFVRNPFVRNTALDDDYDVHGVVDTTWEVTPDNLNNTDDVTNTASSYVPIINIDNADEYQGNYAFQLIVHTTSYSTGYRQAEDEFGNKLFDGDDPICEAYNIPHEQILSNVVQDPNAENPFVRNPFVLNPFVRNESTENPFVQNPFVQNPFVQNSAFAMAPPEDSSFNKAAAIDDGTTKANRAPNSIMLTLRAFQLKPYCDINDSIPCIDRSTLTHVGTDLEYDPNIDLPSAAVGSWPCIMRESPVGDPETAACFNASAADLVPLDSNGTDHLNPSVPDTIPRDVIGAGTDITFPLGDWDGDWVLKNQATHPDAYAAAENGDLTQGYYLCPKDYVDNYPEYMPLDVSYCTDVLYQDPAPDDNKMSPGEAISISPAPSLEIPIDTPPGLYYLTVYADDQVEISELNDVNNTAYFLIEVASAPPVVTLVDDFTADEGQLIPFTGTFTDPDPNDTHTFEWDFGDGPPIVTTQNAEHTFGDEGIYTVTFTVTDQSGQSGSDTVIVTVNNAPPVAAFTFGPYEFGEPVEGQNVPFDASETEDPGENDPIQYDWNFGDGTTGSGVMPDHIYTDDGTYTVTLRTTDVDDGSYTESSGEVKVYNVPPTAGPDQFVSMAQGTSINIGLSATDPGVNDVVSFRFDTVPVNGTLLDLVTDTNRTAVATYQPFASFCGVDSFVYAVSDDGFLGTTFDTASVTITVAPAYDWVFEGLQSPLVDDTLYRAKAGSVVPLTWQYVDLLGVPIDSSDAEPSIEFKGWFDIRCAEPHPDEDLDIGFILEEDPGSSELRYSDWWQFNWQSKYPETHELAGESLPPGCYEIKITSRYSCGGQFDGPFQVQLK